MSAMQKPHYHGHRERLRKRFRHHGLAGFQQRAVTLSSRTAWAAVTTVGGQTGEGPRAVGGTTEPCNGRPAVHSGWSGTVGDPGRTWAKAAKAELRVMRSASAVPPPKTTEDVLPPALGAKQYLAENQPNAPQEPGRVERARPKETAPRPAVVAPRPTSAAGNIDLRSFPDIDYPDRWQLYGVWSDGTRTSRRWTIRWRRQSRANPLAATEHSGEVRP